jgi:low molecular weight protein-tyrosine phosphatase
MRGLRQLLGKAAAGEPAADGALRVLMVCMGNICRSPIAEGVLRAKLQRAGLQAQVQVDSAGTHGYHSGEPPDPRAIGVAARHGVELGGLRARPVVSEDYTRFHWLLAMDEANLDWLRSRRPAGAEPRIGLLMEHARRHADVREVPDPYYGALAGFEHVLALVDDACDGLVERLAAELPRRRPDDPKLD